MLLNDEFSDNLEEAVVGADFIVKLSMLLFEFALKTPSNVL